MPFFERLRASHSVTAAEGNNKSTLNEKDQALETSTSPVDNDIEVVSHDAQAGVQKMEATTQVWTKQHLIIAYVMYVQTHIINTKDAQYGSR